MQTRTMSTLTLTNAPGLEHLISPLAEYVTATGDRRAALKDVIAVLVRKTAEIETEAARYNATLSL
jgi:hypothetical protein